MAEGSVLNLNGNSSLKVSGSATLAGKLLTVKPSPPRLEFNSGK